MHVFRFVGIACLALVWTLCPSLVNAAPILYSRVQVSAQNQDVAGFPVDRNDSGTVNNVDTIPALTAAICLASASAFVTDGVLGAKASAGSLNVGGIQGQVVLRATVDRDGNIEREVQVVRSIPLLDDAAIDALRGWRFRPGRDREGRAVRVVVEVPVRFQLH